MMSDEEIQERNCQLATWTTRIDSAMSLMVDGSTATAYEMLAEVRNEMQATAMGVDYFIDDLSGLADRMMSAAVQSAQR